VIQTESLNHGFDSSASSAADRLGEQANDFWQLRHQLVRWLSDAQSSQRQIFWFMQVARR
jgi:hypothetical protein